MNAVEERRKQKRPRSKKPVTGRKRQERDIRANSEREDTKEHCVKMNNRIRNCVRSGLTPRDVGFKAACK